MDTVKIYNIKQLEDALKQNPKRVLEIKDPKIASAVYIIYNNQAIAIVPISISRQGLFLPVLLRHILIPLEFLLRLDHFHKLDNFKLSEKKKKTGEENAIYTAECNTYKQVIIQKPDLDTCLTALIMGVSDNNKIVVSRGETSQYELKDPSVLCIEAGGSGQMYLNNFDHHDIYKYFPPACKQAYNKLGLNDKKLLRLVDYVSMVDERVVFANKTDFPSLSNIFSGMLLVEDKPKVQFLKGIEMLKVVLNRGINPFSTMPDLPEWRMYKNAKIENQKQLQEARKNIKFYQSKKGINFGFLQTKAIGGIDAIYNYGCEIAVLYNLSFGNPPIPKYTIASKNREIGHLTEILNTIEQGWGGRSTIIGSPRTGTAIKTEKLINILIENL